MDRKPLLYAENMACPSIRLIPFSGMISRQEYEELALLAFTQGVLESRTLRLPLSTKEALETLLVLHKVRAGKIIIEDPLPFLLCLGLEPDGTGLKECCVQKAEDAIMDEKAEAIRKVRKKRALHWKSSTNSPA